MTTNHWPQVARAENGLTVVHATTTLPHVPHSYPNPFFWGKSASRTPLGYEAFKSSVFSIRRCYVTLRPDLVTSQDLSLCNLCVLLEPARDAKNGLTLT